MIRKSSLSQLIAISTLSLVSARAAGAETRVIEVGLRNAFSSPAGGEEPWHTPRWNQRPMSYGTKDTNAFPTGCGAVAWAMTLAYWKAFKGMDLLFDSYDVKVNFNSGNTADPDLVKAVKEIAYHAKSDYRQKNVEGQKGGFTSHSEMCDGIGYVKEKGYPHARCFRINGTEFDKFEHVKRYLEADRPVILAMKTEKADGSYCRGATNHLVVIEKARLTQKKDGDDWDDRKVEYFINFGHGTKERQWITVRQAGKNKGRIWSASSVFLVNIGKTALPAAASANEEACKEWCAVNKGCATCSTTRGCGAGYTDIRAFREAGNDWFACRTRKTKFAKKSEAHREACEAYCRTRAECVKCDTRAGCGKGYTPLKDFKGSGRNFHACREKSETAYRRHSEENHRACKRWCDDNADCLKCSEFAACGKGFDTLKKFGGKGNNWSACKVNRRQRAGDAHEAECKEWCDNNKPRCAKCSTKPNCGAHFKKIESFTGFGRNWFACAAK